jgi:nucleoid-associated protein YgaU
MRLLANRQGPPVPPAVSGSIRTHTVSIPGTRGASLSQIATMYYGDDRRWPDIFNANRQGVQRRDGTYGMLTNPQMLFAGDVLHIP